MRASSLSRPAAIALLAPAVLFSALLLSSVSATASPATASPTSSAAARITCGSTIAADVRLSTDLTCPGPTGLTLASGVTLDLGGHVLRGPGSTAGTALVVEVDNSTAVPTTTIRNGTITGWSLAVDTTDSGANILARQVRVSHTAGGLSGIGVTYTVRNSRLTDNTAAAGGLYSFVTVIDSTFVNNANALGVGGGGSISVSGSVFRDNGTAVSCSEVAMAVTRTTFLRNKRAIEAWWCEGAKLTANAFTGNTSGYRTEWGPSDGRDVLLKNRFLNNGTAIDAKNSMYLKSNTFVGNKTGITAIPYEEPLYNEMIELDSNTFTHNGDAVYIEWPSRLRATSAIGNTGYGIFAPHATDLGGNIARGNGTQPQCTGVSCQAR
ncbi:MAG: hypothetical protein H7146_05950 [Burkholderiaceae bacterium]|nr:hypothetical protein [Microbacteriaceae bacterium]